MFDKDRHWPSQGGAPSTPGPIGAYDYRQNRMPMPQTTIWRKPTMAMRIRRMIREKRR